MAGSNPPDAATVNTMAGSLLRQFVGLQQQTARFQAWMAANDLKVAPYNMSSTDEANIKSALSGLNTTLGGQDMTFINRLTGLF